VERVTGGLLGLLVGDALGVPYEFHDPNQIPPLAAIEFEPPIGFDRAHRRVPPGTWSDDGALALCLLASLLDRGRLDAEDFGRRVVDWAENGHLAVGGDVFDIGNATAQAVGAIRRGVPALRAGGTGERDLGNGSLMRVLPLALWHKGTDAELVADAHHQSRVTHGHVRAQVCCAVYCLWARRVLEESADPWADAVRALRDIYLSEASYLGELETSIRPDEPPVGHGRGYVLDCLQSARWAVEQGAYELVVKAAIGLGNDTDTTACVAGGIAGIRDGVAGIPARWLSALRGRDLLDPLLNELVWWRSLGR
jgi:ADP-ribosylglycohydrolase